MICHSTTPILRIFDEQKAKEFYLEFLEFGVEFEHRFEEGFPLYMSITMSHITIHLSEHHGDAIPGSSIRIGVTGLEEYHRYLLAKKYKYARPGLERTPWDNMEMTVTDPFGNRLVFYEMDAG